MSDLGKISSQRLAGTGCSSAEICRQMGWVAGSYITGLECGVAELLRITAVGEEEVLGREVFAVEGQWIDGQYEQMWDLRLRAWRTADDPLRPAERRWLKDEG